MNAPAAPFRLADLDHPPSITPESAVLEHNLAALAAVDPTLAKRLSTTRVPSTMTAVRSLDALPTWRRDDAADSEWLGGSATPRSEAEGLLQNFTSTEQAVALPGIGTGYLARMLLVRLPHHLALFVFEPDPIAIRAVLSLIDFSRALADRRLILICTESEADALNVLLAENLGLMPPALITRLPALPPERCAHIHQVTARIASETMARRDKRLAETRLESAPVGTRPRLAILSRSTTPEATVACQAVAEAAAELGIDALCCPLTATSMHPLEPASRLDDFRPNATLVVNHDRHRFPIALPGKVVEWYLQSGAVPEQLADDGTQRFAASSAIAGRLTSIPGAARAELLPLAATVHQIHQQVAESAKTEALTSQTDSATILVLAPWRDASPTAVGIRQPTHRLLWESAGRLVAEHWESDMIRHAEHVLDAAERDVGVRLQPTSMRPGLLHAIEQVLIPQVVAERIIEELTRAGRMVTPVGVGWQPEPEHDWAPGWKLGRTLGRGMERTSGWEPCAPGAAAPKSSSQAEQQPHGASLALGVVPSLDALRIPDVLQAAASGRPLAIWHPASSAPEPLHDLLNPAHHYRPFDSTRGLLAIVSSPGDSLSAAARARAHVVEKHTYRDRLQRLLAALGLCETP